MELQEALLKRRSVRKFTDYYVTDAEIKELIEAARWAPSWANTQVWEFIAVRDPDLIKDVVETYSESNPARSGSQSASLLLVACARTGISGCRDGADYTKFSEWFMFDLGMAVENISLKAFELGLGTVVVGNMDHLKCAKLLLVPEDREVVCVLPIGRPLMTGKAGPARKEIKEFVYLDKFGEMFGKLY